jgi:hypothetical protein
MNHVWADTHATNREPLLLKQFRLLHGIKLLDSQVLSARSSSALIVSGYGDVYSAHSSTSYTVDACKFH